MTCTEEYREQDVYKRQGLTCDGSPLEDEEADLIAMYRLLPEEQQEDIFDLEMCIRARYGEPSGFIKLFHQYS